MNINFFKSILFFALCTMSIFSQGRVSTDKKVVKVICVDPWFTLIKTGIKPVEGRKNSPTYQNIHVGDIIEFTNGSESFKVQVTEKRQYPSLEDYLLDVGIENAVPGTATLDDAMKIYYQWSTPEEIQKYGFLGIFIKLID